MESKHFISPSLTPPRSSAPRRSLCLVPGSASVAITPLRPRFVPHCGLRSVNAPTHCHSQSCRHRRGAPHRVCPVSRTSQSCCHSPLRSLTSVAIHQRTPSALTKVRGLTTPFRSDGQTTLPCLQCRLLAPLQSVVRSLATSQP